jgi:two-component system nitrogen regulation sensor histidine kinase NtrY
MTLAPQRLDRSLKRFGLWARRVDLDRKLAFTVASAGVIAGGATVLTMTGSDLLGPDPTTVLVLLYIDAVLLLLLGVVVARRLVSVWAERRQGMAGSGLHIRLVVLFSLVAVIPAILVAVFSGLFLNFGIQAWFNDRVRTAVEESRVVAHAYLGEHRQNIRTDALAMANDLNRDAPALMRNQRVLAQLLTAQAGVRRLPEAFIIDPDGVILARSQFSIAFDLDLVPPDKILEADSGDVVILTSEQDDRVRAVVKLNRFGEAYLVVGRFIEPGVLDHIERTEAAVAQYQSLEERRKGFQITFVMIFAIVALLLLLAAVWFALNLATRLARPVSNLIVAADRVGKGDLSARVASTASSDEIGMLSRAFNRMTSQLEGQQLGLIEANRQLDERRRFTETVLTGVSSGVIGLDRDGRINLPNRSASDLLGMDLDKSGHILLGEAVPEMAGLLNDAMSRPDRLQQAEIQIQRKGVTHTFLVKIGAERLGDDIVGFVVTFDDITELQTAQRKAAWADIARRIAHEIKNPLTPIQLSAERLKRKYLKEIKTDPATFATCTETIVRQVEDIGRMVDEFSSFARMPQPVMQRENATEICRQALFLESNRHPGIKFELALPEPPVPLRCDARQVGRALTNLLKNAAESITEHGTAQTRTAGGRIVISLLEKEAPEGRTVTISVRDNGRGLPKEHRERLAEPYVTSREKGTGLGLAIVKKIMEDHGGELALADAEGGGAIVSLIFSDQQMPAAPPADDNDAAEPVSPPVRIFAHGP